MDNIKKFAYTVKAMESKGYVVEELMNLTAEEINSLPFSTSLQTALIEMKSKHAHTTFAELKEEFDELQRESTEILPDDSVMKEYIAEEDPLHNGKTEIIVTGVDEDVLTVFDAEEVLIERTSPNADDVTIIKEALSTSDARTIAALMKFIRKEVPDAVLKSVPADIITSLCNARVTEIKSADKK